MINELESLRNKIINCKNCSIYDWWKKPVPFTLGTQNKLLIYGRDPGTTELKNMEGFTGDAGQELNLILSEIGIDRKKIALSNIGHCKKANNLAYTFEEYRFCFEKYGMNEIKLIQPSAILILGKEAIECFLNKKLSNYPMWQLRGKTFKYHGIECVCSYHPSYLVRLKKMDKKKYDEIKGLMIQDFKVTKEMEMNEN